MKKASTLNPCANFNRLNRACGVSKIPRLLKAIFSLAIFAGISCSSYAQVYTVTLNGANESPVNSSPSVGTATVTINVALNTMRVQAAFSGLTGTTTACHIHAATAVAGTGTAGVATTTPTFTGFPSGVTSGSYDATFDMTQAGSYNPAYITAHGNTTAQAFTDLRTAMAAGQSYLNIHTSTFGGGEIRGFLQSSSLRCYAYNRSNNHLISFNSSAPGTLLSDVAISGLNAGETITGFDYRPANGLFYAVTTSSNTGRVLTINRTTGVATPVGAAFAVNSTLSHAVDFNPVPDRIRFIGTDGSSRRLNPNDGAVAATDASLAYGAGDPNFGVPVTVANAAYDNSVAGAAITTLFAIDNNLNVLARIGGVNGTPSPNGGVTSTIGPLGISTSSAAGGFDIEPSGNTALAVLRVGTVSSLYAINLSTGAATPIGAVGDGVSIIDGLSIIPVNPPPVVCYAYNPANNHLVSFSSTNPSVFLTDIQLNGIAAGERLTGFDYRPADGLLYGVVVNTSNVGRVVSINRTTGSAGPVGATTLSISNATNYAVDFNPVPDRIRLIGGDAVSRRLNPNDGTLAATDVSLAYAAGDPGFGAPVTVQQAAYDNSVAGTTVTTLFGIDNNFNTLVRVGGVNGTPSPNGGVTTTIGSLGIGVTSGLGGFDIEPTNNLGYAVLKVGAVTGFYAVNLSTGAAKFVGTVGDGTVAIDGLTIIPFFAPTCGTPASRVYVNAAVTASGSGSSWSCAMKELSDAVAYANATPAIKSIWVAAGTYKPTTGTDRTAVIATTRADLQILGGFAGGEANASDANPVTNASIISGDIGVADDMTDNSYRLFNIGGSPATASPLVIDGLIFEKGNANAAGDGDRSVGAALLSYGFPVATPIQIKRSIFRNNFGQATGAVFLVNSNIDFDGCRFTGNTSNGSGGGVLAYQCNQTFANCVFAGNTVSGGGGAFYGNYGTATFTKTTFSGNNAGTGGGVYQNRYNSTVSSSLFNANTSVSGGGGMFIHNGANSTVSNSTFFKNTAASSGGAIVLVEANAAITSSNNIYYKNTANGQATGAGSDITNFTSGANTWANNIFQTGTAVPADNGTAIRNNTRGTDPLFVNEANAIGADNFWGTADDGLALTSSSPAKNTGDNALVTGTTDITNSPRIVCVTVDKGAYENQASCPSLTEELNTITMAKVPVTGTGIVSNPFSSDLQVRYSGTEKAVITIIGANGKALWSKSNVSEGITHVDAGSWSRGIYQVTIVTASGQRMNYRVVKM